MRRALLLFLNLVIASPAIQIITLTEGRWGFETLLTREATSGDTLGLNWLPVNHTATIRSSKDTAKTWETIVSVPGISGGYAFVLPTTYANSVWVIQIYHNGGAYYSPLIVVKERPPTSLRSDSMFRSKFLSLPSAPRDLLGRRKDP